MAGLILTGTVGTILWIISIICIIWLIYDVLAKNRRLSTLMKVVWIVLALLISQYAMVIAIIYYIVYNR
jgi:O-antigen ligase